MRAGFALRGGHAGRAAEDGLGLRPHPLLVGCRIGNVVRPCGGSEGLARGGTPRRSLGEEPKADGEVEEWGEDESGSRTAPGLSPGRWAGDGHGSVR